MLYFFLPVKLEASDIIVTNGAREGGVTPTPRDPLQLLFHRSGYNMRNKVTRGNS